VTTIHPATRKRITRIARAATAHNTGIWIEERQFADHARLEFPSWPRAAEAKGALAAAGFTIHEPGGPVLEVYTDVAAAPEPTTPGYLREVAAAARGVEDHYGRPITDDELLELLVEREIEHDRADEIPALVRDEIDRQRFTPAL
jgi:hypothetical protein